MEYMQDGLGTAALTHTLYDFLAFGFILVRRCYLKPVLKPPGSSS